MPSSTAARQDLHVAVERALRERMDAGLTAARTHGEPFAALWAALSAQTGGGKLLRPMLLLEVHAALRDGGPGDGAPSPSALEIAVHLELLHCAFLLHDDIIDGDVTRRHRPNLIGVLADGGDDRALHAARSAALLAGDALISTALHGFARVDLDAQRRGRLLDIVEGIVLETIAGEHLDLSLSAGPGVPDLHSILAMTASKTAAYSFTLPLRAAAVLAGLSAPAEQALATVGHHLGLAYQLQDDLLSTFGDADAHGKDPFSDLREGKETALIAYARMTSAWASIAPRFGAANLSTDEAAVIREHLSACGARAFAEGLVAENLQATASVLDEAQREGLLDPRTAGVISAFAMGIEGRRS